MKLNGLAANNHIPLWGGLTEENSFYLNTKVQKSGHIPTRESYFNGIRRGNIDEYR